MAQHDGVIDNGPGLAVRTDINAALQALMSQNSGPVEPTVKYPGQIWLDTTVAPDGLLRQRNQGNTAWVALQTGAATPPAVTPWVAYTPTFTGFGTPTGAAFFSRRLGDTLHVRGKFTSGTSTATEARITLGFNGINANVTSDAAKVPSIQLAGYWAVNAVGPFSSTTLIESNVGYLTFGIQNASRSGLTKADGSTIILSGTAMSIFAEVPIAGW